MGHFAKQLSAQEIKQSHLRKLQSCISELNTSGFNDWLLHQQPA